MDDFSRVVWVYLLKDKLEMCEKVISFCAMVKSQFDAFVQRIHSDNGAEFTKRSLQAFFTKQGMLHETSCVDTP